MKISKRTARKEALDNGFRSKFEFDFSKKLKSMRKVVKYEADKIIYMQPEQTKTYIPDWKICNKTYCETKGIFVSSDRKKILAVIRDNPDINLYILFQNSKLTLSKKSKTTYGEWCTKNGIIWADIKDINKWRKWF